MKKTYIVTTDTGLVMNHANKWESDSKVTELFEQAGKLAVDITITQTERTEDDGKCTEQVLLKVSRNRGN